MSPPAAISRRVYSAIGRLAENPRPDGCVKVRFAEHTYRLRVGDHRVIYEVLDAEVIVTVVRVAKRDEGTYRRL
jgi:mRNA interferase RelE/StbE